MNNNTATQITPAQLLTAAREGKITASVIDSDTLPPLAGGGPEQYPTCTIALYVETPNLRSIEALPGVVGAGTVQETVIVTVRNDALAGLLPILPLTVTQTIQDDDGTVIVHGTHPRIPVEKQALRTVSAWKLVYYSTEGDTLNSGRGTYNFRAISSDGCTRGDAEVTIEREAPAPQQCEPEDADDTETPATIVISTGEGCPTPEEISIVGLTEDEAEEVRDAIESAIDEAYSDWSPEHPDESEIYAALVGKKHEATTIDAEICGETIRVNLYAGTHCGQPQFAVEGDDDETVYDDAEKAAAAGREKLEAILQAVIDDDNGALDKQEREAAEALADIQAKVDDQIHARSQRDLPRSQRTTLEHQESTRIYAIAISTDYPLAGKSEHHTRKEWERIYGYTRDNLATWGAKLVPAEAPTPLHAAYQSTLASLPAGTLLLWRLGDFYEIFGEGAKIAAPVLGVALTRRNEIPMAGIPVHSAERFLAKFTAAGLSFALATANNEGLVTALEMRKPTPVAKTIHTLTGLQAVDLISAILAILWSESTTDPEIRSALQGLMLQMGDRTSENCLGPLGVACCNARAALESQSPKGGGSYATTTENH